MKTLLVLPFAAALFALTPAPDVASPIPAGEHDWAVDGLHSSVVFKIKHCNASWFQGAFDTVEGKVTLDPAKPEAGSVQLKIPVDGIDTNNKQRDDHLKNADFFNSKENPAITFQSTKITKKGDAYEVTGDLALAGKSKSITIPVQYVGQGEMHGKRMGYSSTFTIERSDFGMTYGITGDALGDAVTLMIELELIQPK